MVLLLLTPMLVSAPGASAAQGSINGVDRAEYAQRTHEVMQMSMGTFQYYQNRNGLELSFLNWSSDGCSVPSPLPNYPYFHNSCERHDFCYRNYNSSHLNEVNESRRLDCDRRFFADMDNECNRWHWFTRWVCESNASAYFVAVRTFGGDVFK